MPNQLVISNLTKRRAYLLGEIAQARKRLTDLRRKRHAVDKMLRMMDDGIDLSAIKGIQRHCRLPDFKHGEMTRLCVIVLRKSGKPLSAGTVAERIAAMKGLEVSALLVQRVRLVMARLTAEGRVVRSGVHRARLWALA